jgi:cysteine desulfurase
MQPIERIGTMCHETGVRFHVDGTQGVGKLPIDVEKLPIDLLGFAAHKFHGPKGIGALYVRRTVPLIKQIMGGPQERERRGGTENTPGIIGMGVAADLAREWLASDGMRACAAMRDRFEKSILNAVEHSSINGAGGPRIWNTSNIAFERLEAEAILMLLSERGICASGGSACSSGSLEPSPVLLAMNLPREKAHGSSRFSLSRDTPDAEVDQALRIVPTVIAKLRASMTPV